MYDNTSTDLDLIAGLSGGDQSCFSLLYKRFYKDILFQLITELRNQEDAEEVANDVFMALHTKSDHFRADKFTNVRGWLAAIATNAARDHRKYTSALRRGGGETIGSLDLSCGHDNEGNEVSQGDQLVDDRMLGPEEAAMEAEESEMLEDAIATLPIPYRDYVEGAILSDLSTREAGNVLGIPASTSKYRAKASLELLKRKMAA